MSQISDPIFIVGVGRSGTTFMRSLLCGHSRLTIAPESHFLTYWVPTYQHLDLTKPKEFQLFWQDFSTSQRFAYFTVDPKNVHARIQANSSITFQCIFQAVLEEYALKMDKIRWGEKTPNHYEYLTTLLEWFPNAKVIWMIRDPRAVVASLLKLDWASQYTHLNAEAWLYGIRKLEEGRWAEDSRCYLLRYEDLIAAPERELKKVCDFIGEIYEPLMLEERTEKVFPILHKNGWALQHSLSANKPPYQDSLAKWKEQLSTRQVEIIESIVGKKMIEYGYQLDTPGLGKLARISLWISRCRSHLSHWTEGAHSKFTATSPQVLRYARNIGASPKA